MGVFESKEEFRWGDRYELIDIDNNDKLLKLMSRVGESEYIGKQYACRGADAIQRMERLIDHKILNPTPFLMRLKRASAKSTEGVCSAGKVFYLVFEKPFQTLKEECITRKIKGGRFNEQELDCILEACVKGLFYLKGIGESHGSISSSSIFLQEDRTIVLGDPWVLGHPNSTNLFDLIYPSPQKILFENGLIQAYNPLLSDLFALGVVILECLCLETMDSLYQKGFRRIRYTNIIEKFGLIESEGLRQKLKILLDHQPSKRNQIFRLCNRRESQQTVFISQEKQQFKRHYVLAHMQVSQVKTVKPAQEDVHTIINKVNQSRDQSEFSNVTEPKQQSALRHNPLATMSATRLPSAPHFQPLPFPGISYQRTVTPPLPFHTYQPIQYFIPPSTLSNSPTCNLPPNLALKQKRQASNLFHQETEKVKQPEEHFQQKMSLSSIHQNSSRESEDISNLEIITQTKKEEKKINQQQEMEGKYVQAKQEIKEMATYNIAEGTIKPPTQRENPHRQQELPRMNSTIKQLSDESPSREDIELATGEHEIFYETGTRYKGSMRNGKRDGLGTFFYKDGCFYWGEWSGNRMHGKGKLYSQNDKLIYDGNWYMDSFHGRGLLFNLEPMPLSLPFDFNDLTLIDDVWQEYEGEFFWDKRHGKGTLILTNGQVFIGTFDNNQVHGQGTFYQINGEAVSGIWEKGILMEKPQV